MIMCFSWHIFSTHIRNLPLVWQRDCSKKAIFEEIRKISTRLLMGATQLRENADYSVENAAAVTVSSHIILQQSGCDEAWLSPPLSTPSSPSSSSSSSSLLSSSSPQVSLQCPEAYLVPTSAYPCPCWSLSPIPGHHTWSRDRFLDVDLVVLHVGGEGLCQLDLLLGGVLGHILPSLSVNQDFQPKLIFSHLRLLTKLLFWASQPKSQSHDWNLCLPLGKKNIPIQPPSIEDHHPL